MSTQIDPALPAALVAPATPTAATALVQAVSGAANSEGSAPAPAQDAAMLALQKTQVSISPQGRQSLGEATAALQNQTTLLDALNKNAPAQAATGLHTTAVASPHLAPVTGTQPSAAVPASTPTNPVATATTAAIATAGTVTTTAAAAATTATTATAGTARLALPTGGVSAPMQSLLNALVQQTTAAVQMQRVLAAQPWPTALVAQMAQLAQVDSKAGQGQVSGTASLQTWLVNQGAVQTPEGPRGVSVTVRVPGPWLEALGQAQTAATPNRSWQMWLLPTVPHTPAPAAPPLQAVFAGPSQALQSGTYALALESCEAAGGRTSALLTLEFQPLLASSALQSGVYGRDLAHLRQDPWLQIAALQASGQAERDENRARNGSDALCDTVGCPYMGQAACVQPFCAALHTVPQVPQTPQSGKLDFH
ncbi:MAG: hypothetical protein K2X65_08030 [Burkholderiaceae bacterium]|nr:hypothetical protein [Burkholderiaceae bacterium]